ncbi:hypothetical protein I6F20_24640 [Bradyrhizobium sp. IC3123]|uniref:hypothetical protein n=1 Tax=Bradyrhizobium sp. IC3123 TaxID=2793803 RepID=UPI001CD60C5A|nr:hypothetical protein [Bradyrhizobium sp. IC3123]MCA1392265.1 hypothetical protein [Bradyrhizobium sp. IC3123]
MDEHTVLSHGEIAEPPGALIDDNKKDFSFWVDKHNRYAIREMVDFLNQEHNFFQEDSTLTSTGEAKAKRLKKAGTLQSCTSALSRTSALSLPLFFRLGAP